MHLLSLRVIIYFAHHNASLSFRATECVGSWRASSTRKRAIECHDACRFDSTNTYNESGTDRSTRLTVRDRRAKICISWAPSRVVCGVFVISTSRPRIVMRASDSTSRESSWGSRPRTLNVQVISYLMIESVMLRTGEVQVNNLLYASNLRTHLLSI